MDYYMLVLNFDKNNYVNLGNLISHGKKIFLLCYTNNKTNIDIVNEWVLLQVLKKYIPSDEIVLAKLLVNTKIHLLKRFPRIYKTGKELPRIVYIDGLKSITKYADKFIAKNVINWIKQTLNISMDILEQEKVVNIRQPRVTNNTINTKHVHVHQKHNHDDDDNDNDNDSHVGINEYGANDDNNSDDNNDDNGYDNVGNEFDDNDDSDNENIIINISH